MSLLAGLAQGYVDSQNKALERQDREELRKLEIKSYKRKLEAQDQMEAAKKSLMQLLAPTVNPPAPYAEPDGESGMSPPTSSPGMNIQQVMQSPQGQSLALQAGYNPGDIQKFNQKSLPDILASLQTSGALGGGPNGMRVSNIEVDAQGNPKINLGVSKVTNWSLAPDGATEIGYDDQGKAVTSRPAPPGSSPQTKGQTAADQKFASEYVEFKAAGGYADVQKQLSQLREVSSQLSGKNNLTGPIIGNTPDRLLKLFNPQATSARDAVLESVQRNLRLVLGAQFTQKEGEMLMSRAYDPSLPESENKKRVDRLIDQISTAAKAKQEAIEYFEREGTLTGFKGKIWKASDFMNDKKPSLDSFGGKKSDPLGIR